MMSEAVRDGAATLKQQLIEAAAPLLEQAVEKLVAEDGYVFDLDLPERRISYQDILISHQMEELRVTGYHSIEGGIDPEDGQGIAGPHWHQGAGACEIEVDTETGKITVLRYHASSFAGRVVNPQLARLQNDGNVIYGLGPTLLEG
jgi:CO/xanthine dehydrogenase Mo-binding subunit